MKKRRKKRQVHSRKEDDFFEDNDDFWDYYPDDTNTTKTDPLRLDFAKYSQISNRQQLVTSLPEGIYCDLVTTLPTKCSQECIIMSLDLDNAIWPKNSKIKKSLPYESIF